MTAMQATPWWPSGSRQVPSRPSSVRTIRPQRACGCQAGRPNGRPAGTSMVTYSAAESSRLAAAGRRRIHQLTARAAAVLIAMERAMNSHRAESSS